MRWIFTTLFLLFGIFQCVSQNIEGQVTNIFGTPLIGANVYWSGTEIGTITNEEGNFSIKDISGDVRRLIFSYVGFKSDSINVGSLKNWTIQLIEDSTLPQVSISASEMATRYDNTVNKVEVIGTREIERSACCSLAGCFNTNASVDANTTNAITDAKELRILGLSGIYNQLLLDGMPLFTGLSYTYGATSIPGTLIQNIYVSKGANSVLQGYEGIAGQINIIPKNAENAEKLYLNGYLNSFGESQYNIQYMHKKNSWNNLTAAHVTLPAGEVDGDGDNFQDVAKVKRINLYNKWTYDNPENNKIKTMIGMRFWNEDRHGGQVDYDPDRDKGSLSIYGQSVSLSQVDLYGQVNYLIKDGLSVLLMGSGLYHDQSSVFGQKNYNADQLFFNSDLVVDYNYGESLNNFKAGLSIRRNKIDENISFVNNDLNLSYGGSYENHYTVPGIFSESILYFGKYSIIAGLRADKHGNFGWKMTPRFLFRAEIDDRTDIRFSAGKGFRRVHLFSEWLTYWQATETLLLMQDWRRKKLSILESIS